MFSSAAFRIQALLTIATTILLVSCAQGPRVAKKQPIQALATTSSPSFDDAIASAVQMPWTDGNHIETLVNGDEIFPAMLKSIRSAKKSITFETYAFVDGSCANDFVSAFCERARAGVNVHVILDAIGGKSMGRKNAHRMRDAGVKLHIYNPISLTSIFQLGRLNTRDHRKIMVVDGKVGFSGGAGIGDAWLGNAHTSKHWRENHYRVTGPIVAQLQHGFNDNWVKTGGERLTGPDYFPLLRRTGNLKAHAFNSAPLDKSFTIPYLYRQAMASATKSIIIENSYVYLDKPMMNAILDARKRGVHVELILAWKHTDSWPVRYLSIYQYEKLLEAGVHLYEYESSMIHCKVMVVDEIFTTIGSSNIDPRSFYINDESNINVIDQGFAKKQLRLIEKDKRRCQRVTEALSPWNPLSFPSRALIGIIGPQI
ncbi:MAG: phosphatidylserine/phosphatidylglycerophosphate/cardiolipin synthase family protein [Verrucomicrobiae bacterium]|nr:phosphatidylserine/phosphatidylglycerophosphate/cardiolipin synthase family protein [Verrucomicrobiae bacterium]NNJ42399.1 phosphatidylserine/phosphatidylglycerophosphate/cardiolipin synthase family protein [Akkermansiaceae bacterium]